MMGREIAKYLICNIIASNSSYELSGECTYGNDQNADVVEIIARQMPLSFSLTFGINYLAFERVFATDLT